MKINSNKVDGVMDLEDRIFRSGEEERKRGKTKEEEQKYI